MADADEYRCFIGGLSWSTTDDGLKDAFKKFGHIVEAKVVLDKFSGRSRGFGFVSFDDKKSMEEAIEAMHNIDLDGRTINVEKTQPGRGRDRNGDRDRDHGRDRDRDRGRDFKGGSGGGGYGSGGDCYQCGKPGHFARECPSGDGGRGGKYGGRDDRYGGGGGGGSRYGSDRDSDRYGGGGGSRYGSDRDSDRYGSRSNRDSGSRGGDRYSRDRSGPYDRPSGGGGGYRER